MQKKIYLYMCGGLGNQIFQYAAAKNIAINNNAKILIDGTTGFYSDLRDFWRFSLNKRKLHKTAFYNFNFFFILFRILNKLFNIKKIFFSLFSFTFINESKKNKFCKNIENIQFKKNLYLLGYFQSEKYFKENKNKIINLILPPKPNSKKFIDLGKDIRNSNSIAIGLRFHETMPKKIQYKVGGIVSIKFYQDAIKKILKFKKKPVFFIFSTKQKYIDLLLKKIKTINKFKIFFITEENGYHGSAMDNLWLISQCKNHIFSNSTFYWWGAYFSKNFFVKNNNQKIYCSGNFPNFDTCPKEWIFKK